MNKLPGPKKVIKPATTNWNFGKKPRTPGHRSNNLSLSTVKSGCSLPFQIFHWCLGAIVQSRGLLPRCSWSAAPYVRLRSLRQTQVTSSKYIVPWSLEAWYCWAVGQMAARMVSLRTSSWYESRMWWDLTGLSPATRLISSLAIPFSLWFVYFGIVLPVFPSLSCFGLVKICHFAS